MFDAKIPFSTESLSLRDFIRILRKNVNREELMFLYHEFASEVAERTSVVCEMIPGNTMVVNFIQYIQWYSIFHYSRHFRDELFFRIVDDLDHYHLVAWSFLFRIMMI